MKKGDFRNKWDQFSRSNFFYFLLWVGSWVIWAAVFWKTSHDLLGALMFGLVPSFVTTLALLLLLLAVDKMQKIKFSEVISRICFWK